MKRSQFDSAGLMPVADSVQCIHEATVHRVNRVVLAVLFGGQELVLIDKSITDDDKDRLIKAEAALWGAIQAKTPPMPTTPDEAKKLFPISTSNSAVANSHVEQVAHQLKTIKEHIKKLEEREAKQQAYLQAAMKDADTLVTFDGRVLATWRSAKGSARFDSSLLQKEMPEVYQRYMRETTGSRRFLLK